MKEHFEKLVEKAKEIERKSKRCIDFINNPIYEEIFINTDKYYLTY